MGMGEAMMIAGIGCRRRVSTQAVVLAIRTACAGADLDIGRLSALASEEIKAGEPALIAAADALGVPLMIVAQQELLQVAAGVQTQSAVSARIAGVPSLSEAAALAAVGPGARLTVPRQICGDVTCAIAISGEPS